MLRKHVKLSNQGEELEATTAVDQESQTKSVAVQSG